jgi:Domain of unknown function (DUF222)/HNH endonuclease
VVELVPVELTPGEKLIQNQACIDALLLRQSSLAAELAQSEEWDADGYNSPYDWIRFNCKVNGNVASNYLAVGARMSGLEESVFAMVKQEIGYAHLAAMAGVAGLKGFNEAELLPLAKEHSPGKFYRKCLHYRHALDAKGFSEDQEELHEQRYLSLGTAQDGCLLISGVLDPAGGAAVRSVLEPLAQKSGEHDDRTLHQRNADALYEAVVGVAPAHVQVTASIETLKGLAGAAAAETEFSLPISGVSAQRLACDCSVTRVLLSQDSVTIDVGRSRRVVSGALRKALRMRDGHCQWPGCERAASLCQGHHLVHWIDGGETALGNMVLLCPRHHRMVHEGGWQLIRHDDGRVMSIAPTVVFGRARAPDG